MKSRIALTFFFLIFGISGCENDDLLSIPNIDGLSLYWDHEVFGNEGRRLRFEFYGTNELENEYELVFNYTFDKQSIKVRLVKSIDNGKCQYFPMPSFGPDDPLKCNASGGFFIPDEHLKNGSYAFDLITPFFEVSSEMIITNEHITLNIPPNDNFHSSISKVYPIPKDILYGSVVYYGSENNKDADDFFKDLSNLGLSDTMLPDYPYRHLDVDEDGKAIERHWEPDSHSIGFIYKLNQNFEIIFEKAKEHFNKSNLNIYLRTSNGDQALMNQHDGITIVYAQ